MPISDFGYSMTAHFLTIPFEKIQKYLDENNISLSELSHRTGITEEHLRSIFSGKEILDLSDFRTICLALNVMPEIFM